MVATFARWCSRPFNGRLPIVCCCHLRVDNWMISAREFDYCLPGNQSSPTNPPARELLRLEQSCNSSQTNAQRVSSGLLREKQRSVVVNFRPKVTCGICRHNWPPTSASCGIFAHRVRTRTALFLMCSCVFAKKTDGGSLCSRQVSPTPARCRLVSKHAWKRCRPTFF